MARITPAATTAARVREERNAASSKRRARKPKAHKIVFESMTQEKKRLRTVISFQAQPPPGFTFVPAGKPSLTEKCKEYSRAGSHRVFVVSTSHRTAANLSQHVHRIGYHFATSVVNKACHYLGISLNRRGEVSNRPARLLRRPSPASVSSQEKLDQDARDALTDLFPNIPEVDREEIIARAFEKGSKNVGTSDLPLPRRVQLAVLAHIRHVYTSYDTLLRQGVRHNAMSTGRRDPRGNWLDAREKVKDACYMKLLEWRGDEENGKDTKAEMEEILREVIIISDDEDEDSDDSDSASTEDDDMHGRSSSIEFVASQPVMQELHLNRTDQARENGVFDDAIGDDQPYIHDASAEGGRRYAIQTTADGQQKRQERIDRRGFHRYKALKPPQEKTRSYTGEADHLESTRKRDDNIPLIQRTRPLRPMDTKSSFDTEETHHGYTFGSSFAIPRAAEQGRYRKEIVDSHLLAIVINNLT
ncbi:MAG: hypothetical protein M1833_000323 [Piccolia ochrophora]|nr:MAG: hypothetical protein M1833_000323 [Piccolia ochrophora]